MTTLLATRSAATADEGLTAWLAERAACLTFDALPDGARALAAQCLLDWTGVALAARDEPLVVMVRDVALFEGGAPQARILGHEHRLSVAQAARVNGTMGHALDYDDVNAIGHPTAPLAPAVLALGEFLGTSGRDVIAAFVAGYETETRIGCFMGPSHYAKGWHSTATIGAFGAAAASSRLLGLEPDRTRHALALAGTLSAGLKASFGTMAKPLHAGHAAETGVRAALLARAGFTGHPDILGAPQGFGATQSEALDRDAAMADPPGGFHILGNLFKYHAACYLTHSAIEATRALVDAQALDPGRVRSAAIHVAPMHLGVCDIAEPATGLEVKFSLRHLVAMTLCGLDTARPESFSDTVATRADLCALRDRIVLVADTRGTEARVSFELDDGSSLSAVHDVAVPASDLDAQRTRLEAKFAALGHEPALGRAILSVADFADVGALADRLAGYGRAHL